MHEIARGLPQAATTGTAGADPSSDVDAADELRRVDAIIDHQLATLDPADLLDELLARIQALMQVDTVAVLLVDDNAHQLVAHASRGLDAASRRDLRLPLGDGFAGRIAVSGMPVILSDVGPETVRSPSLWATGITSLLGVPVMQAGSVVGVMHVGALTPREFTADDVRLLSLAADRIGAAITVAQTNAELSAARVLQRSLLPPRLPSVDGAEFAARFVPSADTGVGGDWYDAFELPSGRIGLVLGDVVGRGLRSAVVMGRIRSVLRGYALEWESPAKALELLHRKLVHFEPAQMATVAYAVVEPGLDTMTVCCAGHPPPVLACPGQPTVLVDVPPSPPIGVHRAMSTTETTVALPPGCSVAFYTDGLVERRGEPLDEGLERLCGAFTPGPLQAVCSHVMGALTAAGDVDDDIALLAFRRI